MDINEKQPVVSIILSGKHANSKHFDVQLETTVKQVYSSFGNIGIITIDGNPTLIRDDTSTGILGCYNADYIKESKKAYKKNNRFWQREYIGSQTKKVIDELNKYASTDTPKSSPILRQILDIAERGRSLGIILFSAEQFRSAIHNRVTGNCSTHAYGRTNAIEIAKADYKYVPQVYKNMMTRLKQGEYIVQNPVFRSLLNIKFPKPIYKQYK